MNSKKIIFPLLLLLFVSGTVLFAQIGGPPYDSKNPPTLPLGTAYDKAVLALGTSTNEFYCTGASLAAAFSPGEWFFSFRNKDGKKKWVTVEFGGKTHVEDIIARW